MVKLVILLLTGPFIEFDCSRYQCSSERVFFLLRNIRKIDGTFKSVWAIHPWYLTHPSSRDRGLTVPIILAMKIYDQIKMGKLWFSSFTEFVIIIIFIFFLQITGTFWHNNIIFNKCSTKNGFTHILVSFILLSHLSRAV